VFDSRQEVSQPFSPGWPSPDLAAVAEHRAAERLEELTSDI